MRATSRALVVVAALAVHAAAAAGSHAVAIGDHRLPPGTMLDNANTAPAKMIVLRSGGRWLTETRDVVEDYRRLFGSDPPRIAGVAVMTDTDDTGERAEAWYDALECLARAR